MSVARRIRDIDWDTWQPEQLATLMFVTRGEEVLLIRKKRGLGAGKINGPGGKLDPGETPLECAVRETEEELHVTALAPRKAGELYFNAEDFPKLHVFVFVTDVFEGTPTETEEAIPLWFRFDEIPIDEMWEDDRYWLPRVLAGDSLTGWFTFEGDTLLDHRIQWHDV